MIPLGVLAGSRHAAPASAGYYGAVMADTPSAYWRFTETSGTTVADATGNGRTLTLTTSTGRNAPSLIAGDADPSWDNPGTNGGETVLEAWMTPAAWTVEAMINPDATSGYRGIITFDGTSTSRGWSWHLLDGKLHFYQKLSRQDPNVYELSGATKISVGTTHHVALTYDGTQVRVYLDGVLDGGPWTATPVPSSYYGLVVGASHAGSDPLALFFDGRMDEVAFYGSALSAARILAHAQAAGVT